MAKMRNEAPKGDQKYQFYGELFINERSKFLTHLFINDNGKIDIDLLDAIICAIKYDQNQKPISKKHNEILLNTLHTIKTDPSLVTLLERLGKPSTDPNIQAIITATLDLEPGTPLTAMHSKKAILSALLADIRQGQMASCFATAVAMKEHDQNPKQVAQDLEQMVTKGKFVKKIDGKEKAFHIPKIYIPSAFGAGVNAGDEIDKSIQSIINLPGVKKVCRMVGLDLSQKEDEKELRRILRPLIEKTPEDASAIFSSLMHELTSRKSGLKQEDFDNAKASNDIHWELRSIRSKLPEGKYNEIITALNMQNDDEKSAALEKLGMEIGENTIIRITYLSSKYDIISSSIPSNYPQMVKQQDSFKQQLEMNFLAAGGENSLLRSWEYSLASYGRSNDKQIMAFHNLFLQTPLETLWKKFCVMILNLFGFEVEAEKIGATQRMGISHVLDNFLDVFLEEGTPYKDFDRTEFTNAFAQNFEKLLKERLLAKFERGVFILYDKTKSSDTRLDKSLSSPEAISGAIASIASQAAEDSILLPNENEKMRAKFDNVIGKKLSAEIKKPEFLIDLLTSYAETDNIPTGQKPDVDQLKKQFALGFERGRSDSIFEAYTGKKLNEVSFSSDPRTFIKEMMDNLKPMIKSNKVNLTGQPEIMFYMGNPTHDFLLRPDLKILQDLNNNAKDIDQWIDQELINKKKTFIIADLNWSHDGQHLSLAVKADNNRKLKFVCVDENLNEFPFPEFDSGHDFTKDLTVSFDIS